MPTAKKSTAGQPTNGNEPISVADAFGIPTNWNLQNALGNPPSEPTAPTAVTPAEVVETPDEPADAPEVEVPAAEPAPAAQTPQQATEAPKPSVTAPAKPAVVKPDAAKPSAPTAPAVVVPPPAPKIKIGDKEYTEEELKALVSVKPTAAPAQTPAPVAPATESKPRTAEEIAAEKAELKKKDSEWVTATAQHVDVTLDDAAMEKILTGGPEAVKEMVSLLKTNAAQAVLMARKSLLADLDPVLKGLRDVQQPIIDRYHKEESDRAWTNFETANPDLKDYRDVVETIGKAMVDSNSPALANVRSMDEFGKVVGEEARRYISRFNKAAAAGEAPPAVGTPAPVASAAPVVPAAPAAPVRAKVKPPGSNLPTPQASASKRSRDDVSSLLPS